MESFILHVAVLFLHLCSFLLPGVHGMVHRHKFVLRESEYTRLCSSKNILTVNGEFPGPTLHVTEGDTLVVDVINRATQNVTIHWHGVKQPRYPWSDGPEYITQCPIRPGSSFSQKIVLSDEVGTLWWHAHSDWSRATVHGALVVYPKKKNNYPFPKPDFQIPIIIGEWWKSDIQAVVDEFLSSGGDPNVSDAFLINGQPGDMYSCSSSDTFRLTVDYGKTYLVRMINAAMNNIMFFKIADHNLTVVGSDGAYTKPFTSDYIAISPGQTIDFLLRADQRPDRRYYMASRVHAVLAGGAVNNSTTTAIVEYYRGNSSSSSPSPLLPNLPDLNNTLASTSFTSRLRSLANEEYPIEVPKNASSVFLFTLSVNAVPCPLNVSCGGSLGARLRASINNITFVQPRISILQAYYNRIRGIYGDDFPSMPPLAFNYTEEFVPRLMWTPQNGTEVRVLEYDSTVEIVFQGTNVVAGIYHPMHLHGYSFYVIGSGSGNFNRSRDPLRYNLVDPPLVNTIAVPRSGWTAIRFRANNPGVWLLHCHLERHISWGMEMAFIVKNGKRAEATMLPPPPDVPRC